MVPGVVLGARGVGTLPGTDASASTDRDACNHFLTLIAVVYVKLPPSNTIVAAYMDLRTTSCGLLRSFSRQLDRPGDDVCMSEVKSQSRLYLLKPCIH